MFKARTEARDEEGDGNVDPASDRLLLFDLDELRIRMASASAAALIGRRAGDLLRLGLGDIAPEVAPAAWRRLVRRMRSAGRESAVARTRFRCEDGGGVAVVLRLHPILGAGDLVCASVDTDARGPAANRLEAALLRSVIDTAPDAIITIDGDGLIGGFSPAAQRMFGYGADEAVGRNVSMLMPEPYRSQHDGYIGRYLATGEKRIIGIGRAVTARHKSGRTFPIELAVGEVRPGASHVFTGFIRDISERAAAQARVNKLQQELSHVARLSAMGELASVIVHELNQPLTAIANFGEAAKRLAQGGDESGRAANFMEKSVAQAHRASEMIRRLRTFVSRGTTEREALAVNDVVREAARLALIGAADQQVRARFELSDDLPEVVADRIQVQQVVVNLIRNAIDAVVEAGVAARGGAELVVSTGRAADAVLVSVTDRGPGIAPEIAADLFTPFVTTKAGGMGIGLSVSRSIVEAHGGRIWVERAEGEGTRFAFTLPVEVEAPR